MNKTSILEKLFLFSFFFLISCGDFFLRFKYETYECEKNLFDLKKVFIIDQEVGSFADIEMQNRTYQFEIKKNSKKLMVLKKDNPKVTIKINKRTDVLNINSKNQVFSLKCKKYLFKM